MNNKKTKPRLLYIVTQGHWGGAQKYIYDLANNLTNNFDIAVAVGEPDNNPDLQRKLKQKGIEHFQLKHLKRSISPIHDILAIFELRKLYKKTKPDIIHLNSSKASILGSLANWFKFQESSVTIYTAHGWVFDEPLSKNKKNIYKTLEKLTSKKKKVIIVLSEKDKNTALKELKIPEKKLHIIPVGIDRPEYILSKKDSKNKLNKIIPGLSEKDYTIGVIANFYQTKNLDNLISAVSKIKEKLKNYNLILIGDGPEKENLQTKIKTLNLERVYLPGFLENAEQYLSSFDLFVLPSKKEGLPYTLLEAKINKIPIIATDVGAVSTIIENKKTGLIVPPRNIDKLSEAILYAYEHKQEMKQMAEAGAKENLQAYMKQNMIDQTNLLYQNLQ